MCARINEVGDYVSLASPEEPQSLFPAFEPVEF